MDQFRQVRFLYPPLLMFGMVCLAVVFDPLMNVLEWMRELGRGNSGDALIVLIGGGSFVLAAGYALGTISVTALRLITQLARGQPHDAAMSVDNQVRAWRYLGGRGGVKESEFLCVVAAFNHGAISEGHRDWINRRWNAFNLSLHSAFSLIVTFLIPSLFRCHPSTAWWYINAALIASLLLSAWFAWKDTRDMNDLLVRLPSNAKRRRVD